MAVGKADWKTDLLGAGMMQTERGKDLAGGERVRPSILTCTLTCCLVPQLLWSADAERKYQCSFKGKDPQVSQHLKAALAAGWMEGGGPGPRTKQEGDRVQLAVVGRHRLLRWPDLALNLGPVDLPLWALVFPSVKWG